MPTIDDMGGGLFRLANPAQVPLYERQCGRRMDGTSSLVIYPHLSLPRALDNIFFLKTPKTKQTIIKCVHRSFYLHSKYMLS